MNIGPSWLLRMRNVWSKRNLRLFVRRKRHFLGAQSWTWILRQSRKGENWRKYCWNTIGVNPKTSNMSGTILAFKTNNGLAGSETMRKWPNNHPWRKQFSWDQPRDLWPYLSSRDWQGNTTNRRCSNPQTPGLSTSSTATISFPTSTALTYMKFPDNHDDPLP